MIPGPSWAVRQKSQVIGRGPWRAARACAQAPEALKGRAEKNAMRQVERQIAGRVAEPLNGFRRYRSGVPNIAEIAENKKRTN
jgi:hypothetical protein